MASRMSDGLPNVDARIPGAGAFSFHGTRDTDELPREPVCDPSLSHRLTGPKRGNRPNPRLMTYITSPLEFVHDHSRSRDGGRSSGGARGRAAAGRGASGPARASWSIGSSRRPPQVVVTCARGSSAHAATFGKHLIERYLGIPVAAAAPNIATVYRRPLELNDQLFLAISQSGRSDDLIETATLARSAGRADGRARQRCREPARARPASIVLPIGGRPGAQRRGDENASSPRSRRCCG